MKVAKVCPENLYTTVRPQPSLRLPKQKQLPLGPNMVSMLLSLSRYIRLILQVLKYMAFKQNAQNDPNPLTEHLVFCMQRSLS